MQMVPESNLYAKLHDSNEGDWQPGLGYRTAHVTGDGGSVVFMSGQSLSVVGYPHGYPTGGGERVYVYEAGSNSLYCASCGSTHGGADAYLPIGWGIDSLPQWISEDGNRVFFDSLTPLVAQDTNGKQDVYEWEREGAGTCTVGSGVNGGCVFLLSGGTNKSDSWLIGASASGNDVFVATRAQLVPEDQNDAFDLYDVRVDGVKPVSPPECTGTGCQGLPAPPPTFATPSSVTFNGVGNFMPVSSGDRQSKGEAAIALTKAGQSVEGVSQGGKAQANVMRSASQETLRASLKKARKVSKTAVKGRK